MWGKSLVSLKNFTVEDAKDFFKTKMSVESNLQRGYKYFSDSYISDIWTMSDVQTGQICVKAECFKSQRKNEKPHKLQIIFLNGKISQAHCSCAIGNSECCGHLVALCYTLQHFILKDLKEIPEELTCTDLPQKWGKPRGKKVEPECLLNVTVYAPSEKDKKKGPIRCSLSENPCLANNVISEETIKRGRSELMDVGENRAITYLLSAATNDNTLVALPLNLMAQENSILHMQMTSCEFNVCNDIGSQDMSDISSFYKDFPIVCEDSNNFKFPQSHIYLPGLKITQNEAVMLEKQTRTQSQSSLWIKSRSLRFTASNFGEIFYRKNKPNEKFLKRIFGHKDLSHVPSIRHGLINEAAARVEYLRQNPNIKVYPSGLVINPKALFIGASPDSHLVDPAQKDQENGVLEIKCPSTWENLQDGLINANGYLLLCENTGQYILNPTHIYYCQVQGQMLVCGVQWCDFVVFIKNTNELNIQRIYFDNEFCEKMFDKLQFMYEKFAVPYLKTLNKENISE